MALVPLLQLNSGEPDPPAERASSSRVEHLADGGFLKAVLPELASAVDMAQGSTSRIPPENLQVKEVARLTPLAVANHWLAECAGLSCE